MKTLTYYSSGSDSAMKSRGSRFAVSILRSVFLWTLSLCLFSTYQISFAQGVGISESSITPDASAILELRSTSRGFLLPRLTTGAISSPVQGLFIYNTATNNLSFHDGTVWTSLAGTSFANPAAPVGLTAVNGVATTAMRSDAAPALSVSIIPTWTGAHTWSALGTFNLGLNASGAAVNINASSNFATNINTGTSAGAVTIGGTAVMQIDIGAGGTGAKTINVGGTSADVIAIGNTQAAGSIAMGGAMTTGTITIGGAGAQTGAIGIGTGTGAQILNLGTGATAAKTINIGTGAAVANPINMGGTGANVIAIGNTQTAGSIAMGAAMTTGTIAIGGTGAQTGAITLGSSTAAQTLSLGTGAGVSTVNIANGAAANVLTIGGAASTTTIGSVKNTISIAGTANGNGVRIGNARFTVNKPTAPTTGLNVNTTTTNAQILEAGIIGFAATAARTLTFPTAQGATGLVQALPGTPAIGDVFTCEVFNTGAFNVTLVAGTGITIVNTTAINAGTRVVQCRVTGVTAGSETISVY